MRQSFSLICLALLILIAAAGQGPLGLMDGPQAPPYSKPQWLDRSIAGTVVLELDADENSGGASSPLIWNYAAPLRVAVTGRLDGGVLEWNTPVGQFVLASGDAELDLDARDLPFKRALGISPFKNTASVLFPSSGDYSLSLRQGGGSVVMRIEGGRWGWLGTDQRGRDVAALLIRGVRIS
ncbi:MAG: hypothetical protein LBQ56_06975, partial [Synergistaceae bacterium]|nr:hypothetical protein [Synergistaceae bacterium]